jgi:ferrochelatase
MESKNCVWLLNYGGPRKEDEVYPYLLELFNDPFIFQYPQFLWKRISKRIAKKRTPKLIEIYKEMGRFSPIWEETEKQANALSKALNLTPVFVGMRYFPEELKATAEKITEGGFKKVVLLPLYPQESETTTSSALETAKKALKESGYEGEIVAIRNFYKEDGFITAMINLIKKKEGECSKKPRYILTAHSLPLKLALKDNYFEQVKETSKLIEKKLAIPITIGNPSAHAWQEGIVAFQSKVGPMRWLGPSVLEVLDEWSRGNCKCVLVVPISFVSEHSETLYELDILYTRYAKELGMEFVRVETVQDNPLFIKCLADIVKRVTNG